MAKFPRYGQKTGNGDLRVNNEFPSPHKVTRPQFSERVFMHGQGVASEKGPEYPKHREMTSVPLRVDICVLLRELRKCASLDSVPLRVSYFLENFHCPMYWTCLIKLFHEF